MPAPINAFKQTLRNHETTYRCLVGMVAKTGLPGKAGTAEMQSTINSLLTRIKSSGKAAGIVALAHG